MRTQTKLLLILVVLALLTPLGLLIPERLGAGGAWGEWSPEELRKIVGHVPQGVARLSGLWRPPAADYSVHGVAPAFGYLISAVVGAALVAGLTILIGKALARRKE
jgi:hypothetical protein